MPSKASCGLNRNPALCINKYPICPVYGTCFQTQVRFHLHLSFMNYLSHHVLTNYTICVNRSYFECHLVAFECYIPIPLFFKLRTYLVSFELTPADLLPVDSNTLPLCHGRLGTCIVICIFIFKFGLKILNSGYHCL